MSEKNYYLAKIRETWNKYDLRMINSETRDAQLSYFVDMIENEDEELAKKLRFQYDLSK